MGPCLCTFSSPGLGLSPVSSSRVTSCAGRSSGMPRDQLSQCPAGNDSRSGVDCVVSLTVEESRAEAVGPGRSTAGRGQSRLLFEPLLSSCTREAVKIPAESQSGRPAEAKPAPFTTPRWAGLEAPHSPGDCAVSVSHGRHRLRRAARELARSRLAAFSQRSAGTSVKQSGGSGLGGARWLLCSWCGYFATPQMGFFSRIIS